MPSSSSTSSSDPVDARAGEATTPGAFLLRGLLFASPFLVAVLLELCALPLDAFTFRVWEAAKRSRWDSVFPRGPFYPNRVFDRIETGDLGHHTPLAVPRRVRWETDRFGYRKADTDDQRWDVVVVGDSFIAGTGLTQADTLAEQLAAKTGLRVYPLAHDSWPRHAWRDPRFVAHPPRVIVLAHCERTMGWIRFPEPGRGSRADRTAPPAAWPVLVRINHMRKRAMFRYARGRVRDRVEAFGRPLLFGEPYRPVRLNGVRGRRGEMLFLFSEGVNRLYAPDRIPGFVERLVAWRDRFAERGVRFVYMPVPNKENIYVDRLRDGPPPRFLGAFRAAARGAGLDVVDLETPYRRFRRSGDRLLYQTDDSHWTPLGVRIAADLLADALADD